MTFGLTPEGFNQERLANLQDELQDAMVAEFGDINTSPQSVFGQLIGVFAKVYADLWENLSLVYSSQYPNSAFGVSLDNVVGLNGITRNPARQTRVFGSCAGNQDTFIPPGSLAQIPGTNDLFSASIGGTISTNSVDFTTINVSTVTSQAYTVSLNSVPFIYSKPVITFTGSFVTGNSTIVTINGVSLAAVPYNTSSSQTITDIATAIAGDASVASAVRSGSTIHIVPNIGYSVTINFLSITGGVSQPTYAITFDTPSDAAEISNYLTEVINGISQNTNWMAEDLVGSLTITSTSEEAPFSVAVGANLLIDNWTTPILFLSQEFAPVACPTNALTQILTPIGGWNTVTNYVAGSIGSFVETDAELRVRRYNSIKSLGLATVQSIEAKLINVPGVQTSSVQVIENVTLTEDDIVITFSGPVASGQTIDVTYNGSFTLTVPFNTNMATTMGDLATAFLALPQVATAVVSGAGNVILTLTFNVLSSIEIESDGVEVSGSGTPPTAITVGGQPPKSIQAVLVGGSDLDVATAVWLSKPAGISTFGNTPFTIVDSQGNNQVVFFSRPTPVYIWIAVTLTLYTPETFPTNGDQLVAQVLLDYINSLAVGETVLIQRVLSQVFQVPGIASAVVTLAATLSQNFSPSFGSSSIVLSNTQIASSNLQLISVAVA